MAGLIEGESVCSKRHQSGFAIDLLTGQEDAGDVPRIEMDVITLVVTDHEDVLASSQVRRSDIFVWNRRFAIGESISRIG